MGFMWNGISCQKFMEIDKGYPVGIKLQHALGLPLMLNGIDFDLDSPNLFMSCLM